uniref:PI3K/PI4K domain-containing protein n=1 Tax=Macrostomum lignano TaxID=282301 RepID=A0A1I8FQ07_9PLAT
CQQRQHERRGSPFQRRRRRVSVWQLGRELTEPLLRQQLHSPLPPTPSRSAPADVRRRALQLYRLRLRRGLSGGLNCCQFSWRGFRGLSHHQQLWDQGRCHDLRQELLAYQVLSPIEVVIWELERVPLWLRPLTVTVVGDRAGLIEPVLGHELAAPRSSDLQRAQPQQSSLLQAYLA